MLNNYKIVSLVFLSFAVLVILTGCGKRSTVVNVNLSNEEVEKIIKDVPDVNVVAKNTNTNTNINTNINTNTNTNTNVNINTNIPKLVIEPKIDEPVQIEIPSRLELDVDFAPQAPFGIWNELNEEACEEASIITVAKYFLDQELNEQIMEDEILAIDLWEKQMGYKIDLSTAQTAKVLNDYYNLSAVVVGEVTIDRIKYELAMGNLVIVPAAGRELDNPYFRSPGPIYHMLVIKGYDGNEFITNEVGTKRGDGFKYKYQKLIDAVHDWNPVWSHYDVTDEQIGSQPKRMVVVSN